MAATHTVSNIYSVHPTISPVRVPVNQLRKEYETLQSLYNDQPMTVRRFLDDQACQLAEGILEHLTQVHFLLPDQIEIRTIPPGEEMVYSIPPHYKNQFVGGVKNRLTHKDILASISRRFNELENLNIQSIAWSTGLLRYALVTHIVRDVLPSGHTVQYEAVDGEEIPTQPVSAEEVLNSAIEFTTEAISENVSQGSTLGNVPVPYVSSARRFYMPQWVAFDDQDQLLVNTIEEARSCLASMQRYVRLLQAAEMLAPYVVADPVYQQKRYGMLGQLINQGRAYARYQTIQMINLIKERSSHNELNRGLSLNLPYFDEQALEMKTLSFEVIPYGRILYVNAFIVLAVRQELATVARNIHLDPNTRKYLMAELHMFESSFYQSDGLMPS